MPVFFFGLAAIGLLAGVFVHEYLKFHPALAIIVGVGVMASVIMLLRWLDSRTTGIVCGIAGGIFAVWWAYYGTNGDVIWMIFVFPVGFAMAGGLAWTAAELTKDPLAG